MKRKVALFMVLIMVMSVGIPTMSFADANYDEELEAAIIKVKDLFDISDEYDTFNYNISGNNEKTYFHLEWNDSEGKLGRISVTISSTGKITNYYKYIPYSGDYKPKLAKVSKSEAEVIAKEFIAKVSPESINKIKYEEDERPLSVNDRYYYISYTRMENGVPYPNNNIRVSIDTATGIVRSFYCDWDEDLEFPDPADALSIDKIQEIYKDEIGLQLVYKFTNEDEELKPYLVYTNLTNKNAIDAKTGEVISENEIRITFDESMDNYSLKKEAGGLTPAEQSAVDNLSELLSEDEAIKIARYKLNIADSYEKDYIQVYSQWRNKGEFTWNIRFIEQGEESSKRIVVSLDAKTGEIQSFYKSTEYDKEKEVIYDKEEAMKLAEDLIKRLQPNEFKEIEYVSWNEPVLYPLNEEEMPRQYSFNYQRKANGAYVDGDGFRVTVNTVTGEITNYSFTWYKGELPTASKVLTMEKVYNVLFDEIGLELKYIPYQSTDDKSEIKLEKTKEVKLVYSVKNDKPLNIDGNTGDILTYNGDIYKEETMIKYSDINDSFAKSQIEVLAQYGIALPGEKFVPGKEITQKEFLYLLAKANDYYLSESYSDNDEFEDVLYERLTREGIIKDGERHPQSNITKESAVKFIIRALNYDNVASIKGIYVVNFIDADQINPELVGHIAIASGLGIINGYNGYLNPRNELTREQGAMVIYNLLSNETK